MTPEAIALHHLDNFDAKVHSFTRDIREDRNAASAWTPFNQSLQRRLFKGGADAKRRTRRRRMPMRNEPTRTPRSTRRADCIRVQRVLERLARDLWRLKQVSTMPDSRRTDPGRRRPQELSAAQAQGAGPQARRARAAVRRLPPRPARACSSRAGSRSARTTPSAPPRRTAPSPASIAAPAPASATSGRTSSRARPAPRSASPRTTPSTPPPATSCWSASRASPTGPTSARAGKIVARPGAGHAAVRRHLLRARRRGLRPRRRHRLQPQHLRRRPRRQGRRAGRQGRLRDAPLSRRRRTAAKASSPRCSGRAASPASIRCRSSAPSTCPTSFPRTPWRRPARRPPPSAKTTSTAARISPAIWSSPSTRSTPATSTTPCR